MKNAFGFKSEIFKKRIGRVTLQHEQQVNAYGPNGVTAVSDALKATGKYKFVCNTSRRYSSGTGPGGSPIATQFFVLAYA